MLSLVRQLALALDECQKSRSHSAMTDRLCPVATIPSPDDYVWQQARAVAQFYEANRASFEYAASVLNQVRPVLDQMAPTIHMVQRMPQDMNLAAILARQQAALTAMTIPMPTEADLAETQDRLTELVPETDEEREQVAQQAAEIEADPQGKKLIEQITGWVSEIVTCLEDVAAKYKTGIGLTLLAFLCLFVVPHAEINRAALYSVAAAVWLMRFPPSQS